ncbi:F0F1 ATP synthase subunit alpha [Coriobacteriales bacterium OH1046]|nr:F0F1 ATP synthase subunit alpha [Coriobacteriales bacterium OH1046]
MDLKPQEISALIKERIKHYEDRIEADDIGRVITVGDGIALAQGLEKAMSSELVEFEDGTMGMILNLEEESVGIVILGSDRNIKEGQPVKRIRQIAEVKVGDAMLGRVVNALGEPIDGRGPIESDAYRPIERVAPGVMTRKSVNQPLMTGLKVIDSMIPIGKGQRELIIGDRQTGKTAIAIDTIINQRGKDVLCIYVAIGQKASTVAQLVEKLKQHGALDYTTVVVATASESAPMLYIAPYAGCAIGEEWMEQGKHVLIVYDDLSKHAVAYRTMSLLLRRPPGREAFPGDVFYLHSRLLERACKLNDELGGGSITALPIIETQAGDISAYIPTNVISITDGQLFLQTELFNAGIRPAVDSGLSVSRVGSAAQTKAMKAVAKSLKLELAQYAELLSFTQFGSALDAITQKTIDHGARLQAILVQPQYAPLRMSLQVVSLYAVEHGFLDKIEVEQIPDFERALHRSMQADHAGLLDAIEERGMLGNDMEEELQAGIADALSDYLMVGGAR